MIERGAIVDLLVRDGESLVLTEHQCLRLTEVPTELLAFIDEPRTLEQIKAHLDERFGPAPEGRVEEIVDDLISHGLIRT